MAIWPSPHTPRAISARPLSTLPIPDSRFPIPYSLLPRTKVVRYGTDCPKLPRKSGLPRP
ncbi:hypothetical protein [Moorena producens]|uniref:hypothetical protein n=1 Tax=Moorena producens TaxID=1155739 RepID=UPI0013142991|nr:hypothetical protein [Moorena producens]